MPLYGKIVVIKRSGADGTEFPLTAQSCLFGRKPDCDIRIQLPHVSKEHCQIEVNENKEVIVTNLSAVNPTRLNGKIVQQSESLKDRDVITIIDRSFRFEYPPELTQKKRQSASAKNETLQVLHVQQVKDTVCLSPGNQRKSTTLTSDASYDLKEAKVIGTELLSEAHIKNATPGEKDASDTEFAHNHRGNQEKLLEGLSPFSQLYKTLKLQFQANDDHQASSKGGKTPRKASCDAAQTPLSRRKSDKISPTRAVKMPMEVKSTPLPQAPLSRITPNRGRKSFVVCEKSAEEAMLQNLVSCVSSEEKNTSEDQLNKEIIDSPRSRRRSKVMNDLQSDAVNGETSQITSNMTNIIVTPKNDRRSTSRVRSSIHIVTSADNEDDGFVEPSVSDNEGSSVNSTPKSTGKGRPRKSPLKDDHAGGNYSVCESVKEKPTVVENLIGTDQETPKRRRRSSQPTPVKSAEKEKDSGEEAQHKQDRFSKAKETPKSKRNSSQFTLQRSISADEVLKEIQELPSSAKKSSEEMASGGKTEMPKKGRKSIESETPASEAELTPKKVSSSPRWRSRSLSPASLETQDPVKKNVNGIITPQEEKKVATPKKTQKSPVINEVSPKQKTPNSSPTRRHSGKAMLKAEEVLSEIESLAPPSGENGAVETGTKKTSSKKRRSGELEEKLAEPPLKRKRVSFAGHLSPELFDKRLPPDSPLRKGAMPTRFSLSVGSKGPSVLRRASAVGIKYSLIKEFSEDTLSSLKPSPNKKASPKKTPSKPNTLSPDKKSPKPIAKTPSPARSVAKTPSPVRKSLAGAAKTPTLTSLTAKIPSSDQKSPNVADVEPSPGQKSPTSAAKTPSLARSVAKTTSPGRQLPASALTITKTPPPGRKSPARSVTMTPSPARSVTKMPSPATTITKTPPPGRKSPARSVTKTPSSARSVTKTSSPARSVTRTPSSNRKSLSSTAKTPSPAMSLAKTPSPGRKSLTGAAKTPSPSGAAKTPPPSRRSLAGAAEMPSANKSVTKTPSTGRKSLGTNINTTPVVSTATPKSGTPYVRGRFSISHISTPSPIPEQSTVASKAEPVAEEIHLDAVTPKPSLRRKNIQSTAKKTPSRRKSSGLDALRSRSGASKANLLVARSWADIVKLGAAKTQGMVFAKKQVPKAKKVTIKKVTSKTPKTPVKKIKDHFSTGHADSPVTIVVGRAHARAVKPAEQVPKLVRNVALMKRSMEMNESFTGIAEMFSTPVNEKPRRTPRRSSASTDVVCSTPVSLTDASVLNTPEETGEMVVSPLSAPSTARRGRYKDAVTCLQEKESSYSAVKTPAKEIIAPINLSGGSQVRVQPSEEVVYTSEKIQSLVEKTAAEIGEGCKKLMRTPKQKAEPLVALTGVKRLMKTPKQKSKQIEDFRGIKRLMRTPKEPKVQIIEDLVGVKRVMTTPKQKASPVEDMVGIKRLMRTPKHKGESVEYMSGISRTMKSPKLKIAPIEEFAGLQELMEQPEEKKQDHESRVNIETLEASETKRESKKHESVKTLAILAQSSIAAQQPPSRRSRCEDGQISVLPTPLNNSGRPEQVKLTMDIEEDSAVKSSTDTPNGSVKASPAQTASTRKSGRGRKASDVELSSLEAISVEVCSVKSDNISKPTTECVKLSPTPKRATQGTENKDTSRSDTLGSPAFEIALVQESSIDSIKLSTPSRRSQHGNEKDTVQNESSLLSPPANKPQRGKKGMQNVEQNHASIELTDLTVEIVKASPVSKKWTHSGQIKEVEMPATPLATKSGKETKQKIEEVAHMLNEVAAAEERVSQSVSSPAAKRSHHGAIKDVAELDTSASPAAMKKALRGRKARHHSDDTQETSTEVVAAESVMHLPMLKRSQRGAVKDVTEKAITSSPAPKKSGRGRKAKQNSEDKHETSTEVVAAENIMSLPMPKRSRRGAVNDIVEEEITASPAPLKKSGRGRKAKPNSDDIQETSAEVVVAEESSPFSTAKRSEQGAVKGTTELETTASPAPIKTSGKGRKAKPNSDDTQVTAVQVVSAGESLPESVMRTPRTKKSQGAVKDTAELETTASPAPTKKSGRGRKAKQNSKDQPEPFTEVVAAEESCPENVILSPATKRLQQGAVKGTVGVETTTSPAPTKKSGRGRKPKPNLDGRHETPVEAVAAESVISSPSTKRSRRGAKRDSAEVETTISSAPTKISGRGRKAKQNTEETSLEVVAVEESCPESLMLSPTPKRSRRGVVNHTAEVKTIASPAHAKKYGRGRTAKQNSNDTQETSIEVTAAENCPESVMPSPTTKRSQRGAMKNTAEAATTAAPIKKSGRGRKVKHVEEIDHTSTEVPEESQAESVKMSPLSKRSRRCSIEDTDMQKTRCGKKVAPVRETRGATKKNADDAETEEPETSKNSVIMDEIKNLSKKNVKWSTVLTVENDTPENNAVEHLPATDKRLQRGKARSEKGETLDLDEVPVQLAKPRRGRPGRKPKMTEAEIVQEQVADEPSSKEESKPAVWVSSKREASLEIISSNVTVIEKEGLRGKSGSKRKMICKESANANFEEQEHLLIEVAPKRGRRGKAKTTVDEEAQSSTGPSASTVEIKAVSVVETMKPRSIKRTGRTKASSQQKLDLPKETNDHVIDESASQAEKLVKSKKPIGRGKRKLELEAETEADVSFLSPLMSTRGKRANLTNEAETRTLETAANDENVTRGKVSRRGAAASDKKTAAAKTEGKPVRSTRRR